MRGVPNPPNDQPGVPAFPAVHPGALTRKEPIPEDLAALGRDVRELVPRTRRGSADADRQAAHDLSAILKVTGVRGKPTRLSDVALRVQWITASTTESAGMMSPSPLAPVGGQDGGMNLGKPFERASAGPESRETVGRTNTPLKWAWGLSALTDTGERMVHAITGGRRTVTMTVTVFRIRIPAMSTRGYGYGTAPDGQAVTCVGGHRPVRGLGQALGQAPAPVVAAVEDWQIVEGR